MDLKEIVSARMEEAKENDQQAECEVLGPYGVGSSSGSARG